MRSQPRITLIGAGPGDPELITIKGQKALQTADVILYDALVHPQLLELAPGATCIFVGKRKGYKTHSQEAINRIMVEQAMNYGHVVRLKGGDSFVFGRGFEELEYAVQLGISVQVIPGISSSLAVPALAGIPVTHRGLSNGVYILTAVLADGSLNPEIRHVARLHATVVILMGLHVLTEIATVFCQEGKRDKPVSVIGKGSLPEQEQVTATMQHIAQRVREEALSGPAIIVAGEVVRKSRIIEACSAFQTISPN